MRHTRRVQRLLHEVGREALPAAMKPSRRLEIEPGATGAQPGHSAISTRLAHTAARLP